MEKAMLKNIIDQTGKPLDQWLKIVKKKCFLRHNDIVAFLKEQFSLTHGYANLIARKSK